MSRKVNDLGLSLIKASEGCRLKAYADPASPLGRQLVRPVNARQTGWQSLSGAPWTIGYGATGLDPYNLDAAEKPTPIGPNTVWTQSQADQRLADHVNDFAAGVEKLIKPDTFVLVTDNQFAAMVSFAYNLGLGNLKNSSLLRLVNARMFDRAAEEFGKWTKAQGVVLAGLVTRRANERRLFLTK